MLAECHFFVNIGNEYKISIKMQLILSNELHLKVTIPNTAKFVNCCYLIITSHTMKMEVEGVSYGSIKCIPEGPPPGNLGRG